MTANTIPCLLTSYLHEYTTLGAAGVCNLRGLSSVRECCWGGDDLSIDPSLDAWVVYDLHVCCLHTTCIKAMLEAILHGL